jgi:hypothetical protein
MGSMFCPYIYIPVIEPVIKSIRYLLALWMYLFARVPVYSQKVAGNKREIA